MLLEWTVRFNYDFSLSPERLKMSDRSEKLATYARRYMENKPQADAATLKRNEILDEGFKRLKAQLISEIEKQVDDFAHEAGCANYLVRRLSGDEPSVYQSNDADSFLRFKFDAPKRQVTIVCDKPTKFKHLIEVRLTNNQTSWYLAEGKSSKELNSTNDVIVPTLVENGLFALFGVER